MFSYGQVSITDSAPALIVAADSEHITEVTVSALYAQCAIYFGDSGVTSSTGFFQGNPYSTITPYGFQVHLHPGQDLYAIAATGNSTTVTYVATALQRKIMSVIMGTATVPANSTVTVFILPAGLSNFTLYQPTTPQAVYLGTSARVTAASGMPVPVTPLSQEAYNSVGGATYYATTGNGTASSFCFIISTGN